MLELEAFGENADGGTTSRGQSFDGEERLVLLGFEAGCAGGHFAEIEEAADFVAKVGQRPVVHFGLEPYGHFVNIISYYDINASFWCIGKRSMGGGSCATSCRVG